MKLWRIYKYTNTVTGKSYVGQTTQSINTRTKNGKGYHKGSPFREAIDQYGFDVFEQSILRLCTSQEEADQYERHFIEKYNTIYPNGYNLESGGKSGMIVNDSSKRQMSESHIGKQFTEETKEKLSKSHKGENAYWFNKCLPEETKQKMADAHKGNEPGNKGMHWFNNGINNIYAYFCPEGFVPGRLKKVTV